MVKEETGAVYAYYNNGKQDGGWIEKGKVAEGPPYYGGSPGEGVRFAGESNQRVPLKGSTGVRSLSAGISWPTFHMIRHTARLLIYESLSSAAGASEWSSSNVRSLSTFASFGSCSRTWLLSTGLY